MQRIALILLFLVVTGAAAIFAAGHLGINLPWNTAVTEPEATSQDRDKAASEPAKTAPEAAIEETAKALGTASDAPTSGGDVAIDISRISPDGTSVFAGRAAPDSYVTVLEHGKPAGTAKTDENGEWTLSTEHKFATADPSLSYEVSRTPPPEPEKPAEKVASTAPPSPQQQPEQKSAAAVAGDVMRKFENLVEQAREEAKQQTEDSKSAETAPASAPKESAAAPADEQKTADVAPPKQESAPVASADAGSSSDTSRTQEPAPQSTAEATVTVVPDPPRASASSEGVKTDVIPVPIMFVYNEAILTPAGERAAALLLEYLTLKHLTAVELTGHADERGTNEYNYDLSRERLETVAKLLKDGGYAGGLKLTPKGKTEPYMGVDRSAYTGEALYQLDRRVELRVTR